MISHRLAFLSLAAACLAPATAAAPRANLVVSKQDPALTLQIDPAFKALKPLKFPIEDLTNAERRIFVAAGPGRVIDRMVIVQFEKVRPGSDFRFLYPSKPPRQFGAEIYRYGAFAFNDVEAAAKMPKKEPGLTRAFLKRAGYKPATLYRAARLARVTDAKGLSEVIIFYLENADANPPTGKPDEDGDYAVEGAEREALTARMEQVVKVVRG